MYIIYCLPSRITTQLLSHPQVSLFRQSHLPYRSVSCILLNITYCISSLHLFVLPVRAYTARDVIENLLPPITRVRISRWQHFFPLPLSSLSHCNNSQHVTLLSLSQGTMIRCVPSVTTEMFCVTCWHRGYHNYCSYQAEHSGFHSWQGLKCLPSPQRADRFWYPLSGYWRLSMGIKRAEREAYRSPVSQTRCDVEQCSRCLVTCTNVPLNKSHQAPGVAAAWRLYLHIRRSSMRTESIW